MSASIRERPLSLEVDRIIGRPYAVDGRGPVAYNCLGVLLWLYARRGVELPDPLALGDDDPASSIRRLRERFEELELSAEALEPLDAIVRPGAAVPADAPGLASMWRSREPELAVVETPSMVVSAVHGGRVVRAPVSAFLGPSSRLYRHRERGAMR